MRWKAPVQKVSEKIRQKVEEAFPHESSFERALEKLIDSQDKTIEMLKAGKEAGSHLETSQESSVTFKLEPASPATYDWTQVPECPLRYEEQNICFYKKPGRKAIIEHVEPWMCQRCDYTLKINQKVKEIEDKAINEGLRTSDWLYRHQLDRAKEQEKDRPPETPHETPQEPCEFLDKEVCTQTRQPPWDITICNSPEHKKCLQRPKAVTKRLVEIIRPDGEVWR